MPVKNVRELKSQLRAKHKKIRKSCPPEKKQQGAFSIMEPNPEVCEKYEDFSHGLCLVPGLCFDMQGFRLGFGKGYYDRFLQNFSGTSVGLCYSKCIEHTLPSGVFDRPVDAVITEKYTNRTNNEFVKE